MNAPVTKSLSVLRSVLLSLTLLLVSGCGDESLLGPDDQPGALETMDTFPAKRSQSVPFKGEWTNTETPPSPPEETPDGCAAYFNTSQVGQATHLGRFTGTGATCAFNLRMTDDPPFNRSGGPPPFFVADFTNEMTWTAANGDQLFLSPNEGVFVQSLTDGTSSSQGFLTISGGTGRFEGATGSVDVLALGVSVRFDGWITYDASSSRP
jgi:hypothetical protein